MNTFHGIAVDAGVSIDGDCTITHAASHEAIEINIGPDTGGLELCLSENAATKLLNVMTAAVVDFASIAKADQSSRQQRHEIATEENG